MHGLSRWCCGQITPVAKGRLVWIRAEGMLYSVFFFFSHTVSTYESQAHFFPSKSYIIFSSRKR